MAKKEHMSSNNEKKPFKGYYSVLAGHCGCTPKYVRMVLAKNMGVYKGKNYTERSTPLTKLIEEKDKELRHLLNPPTKK